MCGWADGRVGVKAILRIAYSDEKNIKLKIISAKKLVGGLMDGWVDESHFKDWLQQTKIEVSHFCDFIQNIYQNIFF